MEATSIEEGIFMIRIITLSSCGTSPSAAAPAVDIPTSPGTLKTVTGQVLNPHDLPAIGTYEGAGLEMVVTDTGATLNTGCRKGAIPTPLTLSSDGSFATTGTLNPELPMATPTKTPIALEGKYSNQDQAISLSLTVGSEGEPQNFNLVLNAPKNLDAACPI
jgi:hypothetical protein